MLCIPKVTCSLKFKEIVRFAFLVLFIVLPTTNNLYYNGGTLCLGLIIGMACNGPLIEGYALAYGTKLTTYTFQAMIHILEKRSDFLKLFQLNGPRHGPFCQFWAVQNPGTNTFFEFFRISGV